MKPKEYFQELAEKALNKGSVTITNSPRISATLLQGDQVLATGQTEVSTDDLTFYPRTPKRLDAVLRAPLSLKVTQTGTVIPLLHSQELFEVGSELMWSLEIDRND